MPPTKIQTPDPALEAQVFWLRYRREIAGLLIVVIIALFAFAGYRFYRDRRDAAASAMFGSAKTANDYAEVIDRYRDSPAAATAYLLLADGQRKEGKFAEANATLEQFINRFPQHELLPTARMAMAANFQSLGKTDEALATYQLVASVSAANFNASQALFEQAQILQAKNQTEDARRVCEKIMTQYRESYAAMQAARLLRTLKPAPSEQASGAAPSPATKPAAGAPSPSASAPPAKP